MKPVMLNP